jgi:hypothetical protein
LEVAVDIRFSFSFRLRVGHHDVVPAWDSPA